MLTQCTSVTDGRTDGQNDDHKDRATHSVARYKLEKAPRQCKPSPGRHIAFQLRDHSILHIPFPIDVPFESSLYLHPTLSGTRSLPLESRDFIRNVTI